MTDEGNKARRIAIVSGKGGVGKTVIAANLAAALSSLGRRVLVLDADLGLANLDILLGVDPQFTVQDVLRGRCLLDDVLFHTRQGFDLLPAGSGLPEGTLFTTRLVDVFDSVLSSLENRYDVILFDAGAGVGDVVLHFANLAHEVLLVVTPEPTSLMDAYAVIKILNKLHERKEFLLLVNQANPKSYMQVGASVAQNLQSVISQFLGANNPVRLDLMGCIPQDPAVPDAIKRRQLLGETAPQAASTCRISQIADALNLRIGQSL